MDFTCRTFLGKAAADMLGPARRAYAAGDADLKPLFAEADKHHTEAVERLQHWIQQPSIAAENRGMTEGCELMMRMLRDAGFGKVEKVPTDGPPAVFATLDAGATRTVGIFLWFTPK